MSQIDPLSDPRWGAFVTAHSNASIYHHPGWIGALISEYGQSAHHLACEREDGELVGIFPLIRTRGLPFGLGGPSAGRRLASLPRTPLGGPISDDPLVTSKLLQEASGLAGDFGAVLQIKSAGPDLGYSMNGLHPVPWRFTYVLQLPRESAGPFRIPDSKERAKIKWAVTKAAKSGITIRSAETEDDLRKWYRIYLSTMRRSFVPPRPLRFFRAIWASLRPAGMMDLLLAESNRGLHRKVVAGSIFFYFKDRISYSFSGLDRNYSPLRANDAILWHAINDACARGFRGFDFGEVPEGHKALVNFKTKWGAEPQQLYRYYSAAPESIGERSFSAVGRLSRVIWGRIPLGLTRWIGDRVYSYL